MNDNRNQVATQGGLSVTPSDIYFILFRHKIKIVFFVILGLACGAVAYKKTPSYYQSNAKLLVKYVSERRDTVDENGSVRESAVGARGSEHIKATELSILTSLSLAEDVAEKLHLNTPNDNARQMAVQQTVGAVSSGMLAEFEARSNILSVSYSNTQPGDVQNTLQTIIETYLEKHYAIHRAEGTFDEYLTIKTDELRANLLQIEESIIKTKQNAGIVSIEQSRNSLNNEIGRTKNSIFATQTERAEANALLKRLVEQVPSDSTPTTTKTETVENSDKNLSAIRDFETYSTRLNIFREQEIALLTKYSPESARVKAVSKKIGEMETELERLVAENPTLAVQNPLNEDAPIEDLPIEVQIATLKVNEIALKTKQDVLEEHLNTLFQESTRIDGIELTLNELGRKRDMEAAEYNTFLASLRQNQLDEEISRGQVNNITIIQDPTPPSKDSQLKTQMAGGIAGGVAILGFLWAFAKELLIDRTIKRPEEVQKSTGLPLFLSIPDNKSKAFRKLTKKSSAMQRALVGRTKASGEGDYTPKSTALKAAAKSQPNKYGKEVAKASSQIAPWESQHSLHNYFEALRDRVIGYFESRNLQHNPKLIALTGVGNQSGVSTIASGLAGSLSKTEGGNVLLVDMTLGQESAQQFYKGEEVSTLDEALESKESAKLDDNLYVVAEGTNGFKLPAILPSRFNSIVPKLKASDFDYIIFDMPAVSPISATPRLASFMDVVLMVMESEKTDGAVAKQATELLSDSKAHLGVVLNKTKSYVPKQLEQDFTGL